MEARISPKGQVTLPVIVRRRLNPKTGDVLKVAVSRDVVTLGWKLENCGDPAVMTAVLQRTAGLWRSC